MPPARFRVHDHFQLELKLETPYDPKSRRSTASYELWLYFPPQLGIDEPAFDREEFYAGLTAYLRFQTPRMSLSRLVSDPASPLAWLTAHEGTLTSGTAAGAEERPALRQLRLFAAIVRSTLRDERHFLITRLRAPAPQVATDAAQGVAHLLSDLGTVVADYRTLRRRFLDARTPPRLREAFDAIDDFLSLQAAEAIFAFLHALAPLEAESSDAAGVATKLRAVLAEETRYRVASGYAGEIDEANAAANERFVQRLSLLKKYVLEVLHLQQQSTRRRQVLQDISFGIAAAVAMFVAVVLQLVALWTIGTPQSPQAGSSTLFAFVALAVAGYILKDAVKDRLKQWFQAGIPRWLFDRRQALVADGAVLGAVEETVRLVRPQDVPQEVCRARERGEEALFAEHRAAEDVIHYRRTVHVDGVAARHLAPEMGALNEILRLNVQRWLRRMDEPRRYLYVMDPDQKVRRVPAPRTYRVNLVMALPGPNGRVYERCCVVLSREGLQRIEPIEVG